MIDSKAANANEARGESISKANEDFVLKEKEEEKESELEEAALKNKTALNKAPNTALSESGARCTYLFEGGWRLGYASIVTIQSRQPRKKRTAVALSSNIKSSAQPLTAQDTVGRSTRL